MVKLDKWLINILADSNSMEAIHKTINKLEDDKKGDFFKETYTGLSGFQFTLIFILYFSTRSSVSRKYIAIWCTISYAKRGKTCKSIAWQLPDYEFAQYEYKSTNLQFLVWIKSNSLYSENDCNLSLTQITGLFAVFLHWHVSLAVIYKMIAETFSSNVTAFGLPFTCFLGSGSSC